MSEPVSVSEKQVVLRFRGIDLHVDSDTKRIVASSQNEKLQVYTQSDYGPGYSRCVASIKSFDEDGKPSRLSQAATISVQRQLFTPTNDYKGKDMKQLFRQYLLSRGLANLVPASEGEIRAPVQALRAKQGVLKVATHKTGEVKH